jgi:hypothetical protein
MVCGDLLPILLILLIVVISYRLFYNSDYFQLKCIISSVDGQKYCVREREKLEAAADRLATVNENMKAVVNYCIQNNPNRENVKKLKKGFNPKKIVETLPTSAFTAYSENKGEKLAFCLDSKKGGNGNLIDMNTLTFVALHELGHVCTKSIGHTPEFWENFKFLLQQAEKINVYKPVDYSKKPKLYCGMNINHNPYYD